jgi:hypothetical protein
MENIPPITHPEEIGQSDPNTGKDESTGSSPRSLPLMQQTTWSDCSAAQNSIGSSSDFNVRAITRSENPLPTVADATEPSQTNLSTSAASPTGRGGLDPWSADDLPTELTPRSDWVPAAAVLQADPILAQSNDAPVPEVTNDSTITEVVNDSPVPEMTNDNPVLGATNNNPVLEVTNESPARVVTFENPVSVMINEGSYEPSPSTISPNVSNNTVPSYAETADLMPPDEEIYRLRHNEESRTEDWEVLDFCKASRARLYNYYITRVQKLRVLCDQGKVMTDLPVHSEEDYALLRALTRTNGGSRWWTIMIDDLKCPECVSLLKARRKDPKVRKN